MTNIIADHLPAAFGPLSLGEALAYNSALAWVISELRAEGITDTAHPSIVQFAIDMIARLEAGKQPIEQENFFDAVRNDADLTPEQKAYWLAFEQEMKAADQSTNPNVE